MSYINEEYVYSIYDYIFSESLIAHDTITHNYPQLETDIKTQKWAESNYATDKERLAHAFTVLILTHMLC